MPPATKKGAQKEEQELVIGSGKFYYPNGDVYEGEYATVGEGVHRHGTGTYTMYCSATQQDNDVPEEIRQQPVPQYMSQDVVSLSGTWQDDALVEGRIIYASGDSFEGRVDSNCFYVSGGRYTWPDGSWYAGDFSCNVLHGVGTYYSAETQVTSEGIFRNNHGPGLDDRHGLSRPQTSSAQPSVSTSNVSHC